MKDLEVWAWFQTGLLTVLIWTALPAAAGCPWWCSVIFTVSALYLTRVLTIVNRRDARQAVRQAVRQVVRLAVRQG